MKFFSVLFSMSLLALSSANADPTMGVHCRTESNGYAFEHTSNDYDTSRQAAVTACQSVRDTAYEQCTNNLQCGNGGRNDSNSYDRLLFGMIGTWKASNCSNCYLQVYQYNNQLYADMIPWEVNRSYSQGLQPITFLSSETISYRNDVFRLNLINDQYSGPTGLQIDRVTDYNSNVIQATKNFFQPLAVPPSPLPNPNPNPNPYPNPQNCPRGTVWDYNQGRCVGNGFPNPRPQNCPPGTVWDYELNRCVSVVTPPRPQPIPIPFPNPGPAHFPNPRPQPSQPCPPGTVWDYEINRCVSVATPPRPQPQPPRPQPAPFPQPQPLPGPRPGGRCPPGTHMDPDIGRCVADKFASVSSE